MSGQLKIMLHSLQLWRDPAGRLSALRIMTLCLLVAPIFLAVAAAFTEEGFGARPVNDLIHRAGYWALVFLLLVLAVTPLTRIARFGELMDVRRIIGVGSFCYAAAHISLYAVDQMFDVTKIVSEIALRLYLTIGFTALIGLTALAATSTDEMVRRLGLRRWQRLQQAGYIIAVLALIHFFQQTKADVWVPTFTAGLFAWLMGYRFLTWWWKARAPLSTLALLALTIIISMGTFAAEAIGIGIAYDVSPLVVLQTALDFDFETVSPGWLVLGAGMLLVATDLLRSHWLNSGRKKSTTRSSLPSVQAK
jgi:sulfoxide reductase heme-binding subunit YedZ